MCKIFFKTSNYHLLLKWSIISLLLSFLIGISSAVFLIGLDCVTQMRVNHTWLILLLPLGGLLIGIVYKSAGQNINKGNNLIIETIQTSGAIIPVKIVPIIFFSTLITHLFGGSAGREGTAVQMAGAIADQFSHIFKLKEKERQILLIASIGSGFSAIFGTPFAGIIFGMEVIVSGKLQYKAILLSIACSFLSDTVCHFLGVNHILYSIEIIPQFNIINAIYTSFAGVAFGSAAFLFITFVNICNKFFVNSISNNYLRPFVGGLIIFPIFYFSNNLKYCGLGIEEIQSSFSVNVGRLDFFKKLILTSLTLGSGFKGGEVTPLFYIGSTLGNSLSNFIPLPIGLLAGLGFVSVFGASANTPITTTVLAIEIFGIEIANYAIIACFISYFVSGKIGIYSSQNSNGKYSIFFIIWKKIKDKFELKRL